ncbi:hypothetical protein COCNU_05G005360 [Cocos nucifera]|uniref:Uncharacterized protein n=1 Tax=Cocos nucifera TaxID=13894 RepID=A0A8K0I8F1_COCNU|nr:hypothetical protein COCNU_05G005360 [Cocos nucifera]
METQLASKKDSPIEALQPTLEVPTILITLKVEPSTLTEAPIATFIVVSPPSFVPSKVPTPVEVILLEDDAAAALDKASQADA